MIFVAQKCDKCRRRGPAGSRLVAGCAFPTYTSARMDMKLLTIIFESGKRIPAVRVPADADPAPLIRVLGLPSTRGALVVVGGASGFDAPAYAPVRARIRALMDEVVRLAGIGQLAVIDGGTAAGVMRLLGEARVAAPAGFPLIGVAPYGKAIWPHKPDPLPDDGGLLDENHSAFVLVEGEDWGDETPMLARLGHSLASRGTAIEVLVDGGAISRRDVESFLHLGGELVVIQGSGRFADELAAAAERGHADDPALQALITTGRVHIFPLEEPPGSFSSLLKRLAGW